MARKPSSSVGDGMDCSSALGPPARFLARANMGAKRVIRPRLYHRSKALSQLVDLGRHDEVVFVQSLDLVGVEDDVAVAPSERDIRVMTFLLG